MKTAWSEERLGYQPSQFEKVNNDTYIQRRNIRRDTLDSLKKMNKAKEMTDDEYADYESQVEKEVSKTMEVIEKATADKEKELLTV